MSDERQDERMNHRILGRMSDRDFAVSEAAALVLSVLWLLVCLVYFLAFDGASVAGPGEGLRFVMVISVVVLPVAVIWIASAAARSTKAMREESAQLQMAMNAMRQSFIDAQNAHALGPARPDELTRKLEDIASRQRQGADTLATFASTRPHHAEPRLTAEPAEPPMRDVSPGQAPSTVAAATAGDEQPSLALGTPAPEVMTPVAVNDMIRAINFPESAEDDEGFEALRRALADRRIATLIQASQDVLTLLSQDGIYMDDLRPDQARPEIWRHFAEGQRGRPVAALGGIRDRSSLALTAGRMRSDAIFRDASLHFLRKFDEVLTDVEPRLDDAQMARFGATRTARAFMLLGRVTGTFD